MPEGAIGRVGNSTLKYVSVGPETEEIYRTFHSLLPKC